MRHRISKRKLNRDSSHRRSLFANLASSLIKHEQISTTVAKAKTIRPIVEKLITLGKCDTLHARRKAYAFLYDKDIANKLFDVLGPRYKARPGGYTRIIKTGFRYGDAAPTAIIELVDRDIKEKGLGSGPVLANESSPDAVIQDNAAKTKGKPEAVPAAKKGRSGEDGSLEHTKVKESKKKSGSAKKEQRKPAS